MLTEKEMTELANSYIKQFEGDVGKELVLIKELMVKKNYGIYFMYNYKIFVETNDEKYDTLLGNAPFLVESRTGKIVEFGTFHDLEFYIREYEAGKYSG